MVPPMVSSPESPQPTRERAPTAAAASTPALLLADRWPMGRATERAFHAVIVALCPPEPVVPELVPRIDDHVRRLMRYMPWPMAIGLIAAFFLLDWSPLWRFQAFGRISGRASPTAAQAALNAVAHSRFLLQRTLMMAAKGAILSAFYDLPEIQRALGVDLHAHARERIELRRRLLAGEPTHAADRLGRRPDPPEMTP